MSRFRPEQADSLGIILHYQCTFRCAHCLYACHPGLREKNGLDALDRLLDAIAHACPDAILHVGGGEPFLHMDRLTHVLRGIRQRGLLLEYVETNGFWIRESDSKELLKEVRDAGCSCLLLSISPFHNAFLSCRDNQQAYRMIVDQFGPEGIFPWHPMHYPLLERVSPDRPVRFEEYARHFSSQEIRHQMTGINYLHLAGRAAVNLAPFFERLPPETFFNKQCRRELSSPVHAHVDTQGHYLAGFCTGLQVGSREGFRLQALFREGIQLEEYPLLKILAEGNLGGLYSHAEEEGFLPDPEGYISPCHLCGHLRTWLYFRTPPGERPKELVPDFFYEEMSRLLPAG